MSDIEYSVILSDVIKSFDCINEPQHEISNNVVCATSKASDQPAHKRSLIRVCLSHENCMIVRLLTEHHLEFLSLKGCCTGSSQSTRVKMPHCWKSHVAAQIIKIYLCYNCVCMISEKI